MTKENSHLNLLENNLCILTILSTLFVRFFQTIVLGKPITRLFLIAHLDSMFYPMKTGQSVRIDPSLVQLQLPYMFFVADRWRHEIPLWNNLSGFGMPLLADPQAYVLSPMFALFYFFPDMHVWNLLLIIQLAIGALSTYFLSKELQLGFMGALSAALLFIFCPWVQWQLESSGCGICLTPLIFLFFVRMATKKSLWNAVIAGLFAAFDIFSAHPEHAYTTIGFATLFTCLSSYFNRNEGLTSVSILKRVILAEIIAFAIAAPLIFPFAEFLLNCASYKFNSAAPTGISPEALLANYLFPFYPKGSLFFGPLSLIGIIVALCSLRTKDNKFILPMLACLLISILAISKTFPFNILFLVFPFSLIQSFYYLPVYILLMSLISGYGVSHLMFTPFVKPRMGTLLALASLIVLLLIPLLFSPWHHNNTNIRFDSLFDCNPPRFIFRLWLYNTLCTIAMLLIWAATLRKSITWKKIGSMAFIAVGILLIIGVSYHSRPISPDFKYPNNLPLKTVLLNDSRVLSTGDHLFKPNTYLVYKLPMIQLLNPLIPKGLLEFMRACGAEADDFNQTFPLAINRLVDLSGIRTILSEQPILDENVVTSLKTSIAPSNKILAPRVVNYPSLRLSEPELLCDSKISAIFCRLTAFPLLRSGPGYHLCCEIRDTNNQISSFIEPQPISNWKQNQIITCSGFVSPNLKSWKLYIKVVDDNDQHIITPVSTNFGKLCPDGSLLIDISSSGYHLREIKSRRFKPISRYGSIIAYENQTAFPRQFFVQRVTWIGNNEEAPNYLKQHTSDLHEIAVIESKEKGNFERALSKLSFYGDPSLPRAFDKSASSHVINDTAVCCFKIPTIDLETESQKISLLVASDFYYPGWRVSLDGTDWQMFRVNYLFRAVPIPPGKHHIRFEYKPISFFIGLAFYFITLTTLLVFWLRLALFSKTHNR